MGITLGPDRPKRGHAAPKRVIKSFKVPKTCICKKLKNIFAFLRVLGSKAVQDSLRRAKKVPKRHLKSCKTSKKKV